MSHRMLLTGNSYMVILVVFDNVIFGARNLAPERRRSRVVRVTLLWCRKSLEGLEIAPSFRLSSDDWKTLSVSPAANWYLFRIRERIRQRKERDELCLTSAVHVI